MIRGYPKRVAVRTGETLTLCVAGEAAWWSPQFFRVGARIERVPHGQTRLPLTNAPPGDAATPWFWPEYRFEIPPSWRPGAYVAVLLEEGRDTGVRRDPNGATLDARSARILFVVLPARVHCALLVTLPLFTYHAYNVADVDGTAGADEGACLYSDSKRVTLERPGGGIGGHPWDERNADAYDRATPRQTFAHWDAKALAWLERSGYEYDVCTDLELHDGTIDVNAYRAMASYGHHEYWTPQMRSRVEAFVQSGGNAAFFGGNTMWFRLQYDGEANAVAREGKWGDEWRCTGVTYACGGGRWIGERSAAPFRVQDDGHWALRDTGLKRGDGFGTDERVAGYECDGAPAQSDLHVVARASLQAWPEHDACGERAAGGHAALGVRDEGNGCVFTASTADWARLLDRNAVVGQVSRNVLDRFGAFSPEGRTRTGRQPRRVRLPASSLRGIPP